MTLLCVSEDAAAIVPAPHGDLVSARRLNTPGYTEPQNLFMIYMRIDHDSGLHVRHYWDELGKRDITATEAALLREARRVKGRKPHISGRNFEDLSFPSPCYFTLLLDEAHWLFDFGATNDPITFLPVKKVGAVTQSYSPNHSFYDARSVRVLHRPAIRCINYLKADAEGTPLAPGQKLNFCFEINLRAPFALPGPEKYVTIIIDPTSENIGPH